MLAARWLLAANNGILSVPMISSITVVEIIALVLAIGIYAAFSWRSRIASKGTTQASTPMLNTYGIDFTALAREGRIEHVVGREQEVLRLAQVLSRKEKNNALLIGEPGVGKTALVEALALRIVSKEVPEALRDKRLLSLSVPSLLAGTKYRGEFEERAKKIVSEIQSARRHIILFIDEVHSVIQSQGTEGAVNFADILKPALARGDLQMIGATTTVEYEKYIKSDASLERRFQPILVEEPNEEETIRIVRGVAEKFELFHKVHFTDAALQASVRYTIKLKGRKLPDKALDAIDEAAALVRVSHVHEHIPAVLYAAAVQAHPQVATLWKQMQDIDQKIFNSKKPAKELLEKKKKIEDLLVQQGVYVVDADEILAVVRSWMNG